MVLWVWPKIFCALAPWQWTQCLFESQTRLVIVHSMQSQPLLSSCTTSSSALFLPASGMKESQFRVKHSLDLSTCCITVYELTVWFKFKINTIQWICCDLMYSVKATHLFIGKAVEHSNQKALQSSHIRTTMSRQIPKKDIYGISHNIQYKSIIKNHPK